MESWSWYIVAVLGIVAIVLIIKLITMKKSVKEIQDKLTDRLMTDTNTTIDISSRDRQLRRLCADLNRQLMALRKERLKYQQGDREIKEAVTNISHDLRTPLTAICGYLDLLDEQEQSPQIRHYTGIIRERTETMKQLTQELFRYSVETTKTEGEPDEEVCINSVLEEGILAYYGALKKAGIEPNISITDTRIVRSLNKKQLLRIYGNIISNALKYSDGDLRIQLLDNGEAVFSNHCSSMDEIQAGRLFDRFYTVESGARSTGLGLSIARSLTEQMKGSISAVYEASILYIHVKFPA